MYWKESFSTRCRYVLRGAYDAAEVSDMLVSVLGVDGVQESPANNTDQEDNSSGNTVEVILMLGNSTASWLDYHVPSRLFAIGNTGEEVHDTDCNGIWRDSVQLSVCIGVAKVLDNCWKEAVQIKISSQIHSDREFSPYLDTLDRPRFIAEYIAAAIHVRLLRKALLTADHSSPEL